MRSKALAKTSSGSQYLDKVGLKAFEPQRENLFSMDHYRAGHSAKGLCAKLTVLQIKW